MPHDLRSLSPLNGTAGTRRSSGGATERVVDALRDAIVTLEIPPGAPLDKAVLTARFGVSRFPIAEAFTRLKAEGLVDIRPQSGSTASLIRLADVRENMFLRRALEGEAVALLASRGDAALLEEVDRNLRYQKSAVEAGDRPGFHRLDLEFHDLLVSAVGYPRMRATVEHARLALDRVRRLLGTPRRHAVTYGEHCAIIEAVRAGDPDAARAAMAHHIDSVMTELEAFAVSHPEVFADRAAATEQLPVEWVDGNGNPARSRSSAGNSSVEFDRQARAAFHMDRIAAYDAP